MSPTSSELSVATYEAVVELLLRHEGLDLSSYKDDCIRRRLSAHIRQSGLPEWSWLDELERSARERSALLEALTIHVSEFFRDPETFAYLSHTLLPCLMERARTQGRSSLRAWSLGCACGEEPYSLALLWQDLDPGELKLEILATDISELALEKASQALYDPGRLQEVPPEMLEAFFLPEKGGYRLCPQTRAMVRFEQRDILNLENFPEVDLILCRNLLIYLDRDHQDAIEERFARALKKQGFLVLGHNESLGPAISDRFECLDRHHRIYQPRSTRSPSD